MRSGQKRIISLLKNLMKETMQGGVQSVVTLNFGMKDTVGIAVFHCKTVL